MQNETRNPLRAAVMAGGVHTPYAVAGSGPPAVLLAEDPRGTDLVRLAGELRCRLVAPETPMVLHGSEAGANWLIDFLDGLSLEAITLVSGKGGHDLAQRFAMTMPERVPVHAVIDEGGALTWAGGQVALPRP